MEQNDTSSSKSTKFDLIIRNGLIVDGTGEPAFSADVCISSDRVSFVGDASLYKGTSEIDASGKIVCPGFIDVHTHDDRALLVNPHMACKISQGVTTVITGNCGISIAPLDIEQRPPPHLWT